MEFRILSERRTHINGCLLRLPFARAISAAQPPGASKSRDPGTQLDHLGIRQHRDAVVDP